MKREMALTHEFVEYIPAQLKEGTVYVSVTFATATHKCCCGCGKEVVTPLSPTDWTLSFDGESISLDPSIGNWNLACQSHYWIKRNRVRWAERWSQKQINAGRAYDSLAKAEYFGASETPSGDYAGASVDGRTDDRPKAGFWHWVTSWFSGK